MDPNAVVTLFRSDPLPFLFASAVTYVALIVGVRRQLIVLEDYLHLQVILISAYASVIAVAFLQPTSQTIGLTVLLILYLAGMLVAFNRTTTPEKEKRLAPQRRPVFIYSLEGKVFAIVVMGFVLLNVTVNFMSGAFVVGETAVGQRYLAYDTNPLLKIVGRAIVYFPIFIAYVYRGTLLGRAALLTVAVTVLQGLLVGSKAVLLQWIMFAAYWLYLAKLDNPGFKTPRVVLYYAAVLAMLGVPLWIVYIGATAGDYESGLQHFTERLLLGMLQLPQAGISGIAEKVPELSLAQFYFAPILKAVGAYSSQYDAVNHYYVVHVLGWDIDFDAMRPNNNLLLELVLTQGWLIAVVASPILAYLYFTAYVWLRERRWDSFLLATLFVYFTSRPFFWLIDGQTWFNGLIGLGVFYVIWFVSAAFAKLFLVRSLRVRY
jgi:hypothetical protein